MINRKLNEGLGLCIRGWVHEMEDVRVPRSSVFHCWLLGWPSIVNAPSRMEEGALWLAIQSVTCGIKNAGG
jgi:hypothetical protein